MAQDVKLTVHADGTHAIDQLARAQRAMRAAVLRDQLVERMSLPALIQRGRGVAHDPACAPRPGSFAWSKTAYEAIHPPRTKDKRD